jgi:hypothetical protein
VKVGLDRDILCTLITLGSLSHQGVQIH